MSSFTESQIQIIKTVAIRYGLEEMESKPGIFRAGKNPHIRQIDATRISDVYPGMPVIGISNNIETQEEGTGNSIIESIQTEIQNGFEMLAKKEAGKKSHVKNDVLNVDEEKDPLICIECKSSEFVTLKHEGNFRIYTCKCGLTWREQYIVVGRTDEAKHMETKEAGKADQKTPEAKPEQPEEQHPKNKITRPETIGANIKPPVKTCMRCGMELPHKHAMECFKAEKPFICEECEEKEDQQPEKKEKNMNEKLPSNIVNNQIQRPLTTNDIITYLCPEATESEAYMFLQLCINRGLNPFLREAYLIKYSKNTAASMVVGKDAFTRKAEESGKLEGFKAGIIVLKEDKTLEEREGTLTLKGEEIVGGWAKVKRKDMEWEFINKVSFAEFNKNQGNWKTMPGVMIRKCALIGALREAFTKELGGCYDVAELISEDVK